MNVTRTSKSVTFRASRRQMLAAAAASMLMRGRSGAVAQGRQAERFGDFAGLVEISGRSLWMACRGSGSPTVVLEARSGNNAMIGENAALDPGVAAFTRVCAYDRPGTVVGVDDAGDFSRSNPVPMPLVVLTHGIPPEWPPGFPAAEREAVWLPLQEKLAALVPDSRLIVAERSAHSIQTARPELVTESIQQVVGAVRDPGSWTS